MKKYWIIENEMYSAYDTHTISNVFYGTWFEAARECIKTGLFVTIDITSPKSYFLC